jgi:tRNA(fMet)-specific endonuclease VapC
VTYFLDTDTCVFALKGRFPTIEQWIRAQRPDSIKIPAIVKAELLLGAKKGFEPKGTLLISS